MHIIYELVTNPYIITILLIIGLVSIGMQLFYPGLGISGIIGLGAFALYFIGHYTAGFVDWEAPMLFTIGMVLLILEFFVPSFGIIGIIGFTAAVISIVMASSSVWFGITSIGISITIAILALWLLGRFFHLKPSWGRIILQSAQRNEEGFISAEDRQYLLGKIGFTYTPLRPSGVVQFGEERHDVVSEGSMIPSGVQVKVIKVNGMRVVVRKVEEQE